jgi:hypothetical protein
LLKARFLFTKGVSVQTKNRDAIVTSLPYVNL